MPAHIDLRKASFANLFVDGKLAYIPSTRPPGAEGGTILSARHCFLCYVVDGRKRARSVTARGLTSFEGVCRRTKLSCSPRWKKLQTGRKSVKDGVEGRDWMRRDETGLLRRTGQGR